MIRRYNLRKASKILGLPEERIKTFIHVIYREINKDFQDIVDDISTGDYEVVYARFHKIKSSFNMISAPKAVKICKRGCDYSSLKKDCDYMDLLHQILNEITIINKLVGNQE